MFFLLVLLFRALWNFMKKEIFNVPDSVRLTNSSERITCNFIYLLRKCEVSTGVEKPTNWAIKMSLINWVISFNFNV